MSSRSFWQSLRRLQLLERALLRTLVRTPAHELRAMTKTAVRDVIKADFADQLRFERFPFTAAVIECVPPARTARSFARETFATDQRFQRLHQLQFFFRRERRCEPTVIQLPCIVVQTQQQRPDALLFLRRIPES